MEIAEEESWQAENADIEDNIGHGATDIHDRVVSRRHAGNPIAPERPYLEKRGGKERNQPGEHKNQQNVHADGESDDREDPPVEA